MKRVVSNPYQTFIEHLKDNAKVGSLYFMTLFVKNIRYWSKHTNDIILILRIEYTLTAITLKDSTQSAHLTVVFITIYRDVYICFES